MKNPITKSSEFLLSRIAQLSRLNAKILDSQLAPVGISLQELRIVGLLMGEENITQKELAEKLAVRPATLSVAIKKLEAQGLVTRQTSETDKRVQYLKFHKTKQAARVDGLLENVETTLCRGISKKDLATTKKVITTLINHAKQELRS